MKRWCIDETCCRSSKNDLTRSFGPFAKVVHRAFDGVEMRVQVDRDGLEIRCNQFSAFWINLVLEKILKIDARVGQYGIYYSKSLPSSLEQF